MTPTVAARRFLAALTNARWADAAALAHPESRRHLRTSTVSHYIAWAEFRTSARAQPGQQMSGFGSSGQIDPAALQAVRQVVVPTYRGQPTIGQLAALSPLALTARILDAANAADMPSGAILRRFPDPVVLGHVMDGPTRAHAVIRNGPPRSRTSHKSVTILSLQRARTSWRVLLSHDFTHVHLPLADNDPFLLLVSGRGMNAG